jgi:hypothetical protein
MQHIFALTGKISLQETGLRAWSAVKASTFSVELEANKPEAYVVVPVAG